MVAFILGTADHVLRQPVPLAARLEAVPSSPAIALQGPNGIISMCIQMINPYLNLGDYGNNHRGSPFSTGKA